MCIIKTNSSLLCHIFTLLALLWGAVVNFCVAFVASIGQRRLISRHWSFGPLPVVKSIYELVPAAQHVQHSGCTRDTFSLDFIAHPFAHDSRWNHPAPVRWKVEMTEKTPRHPVLAYNCFDICFPPAFPRPAQCVLHYFQFHLRALRAQPCSPYGTWPREVPRRDGGKIRRPCCRLSSKCVHPPRQHGAWDRNVTVSSDLAHYLEYLWNQTIFASRAENRFLMCAFSSAGGNKSNVFILFYFFLLIRILRPRTAVE